MMLYNWETKQEFRLLEIDVYDFFTSVLFKDKFFFIHDDMQIYKIDEQRRLKSLDIQTSGYYRASFGIYIQFAYHGLAASFGDYIYICRPEFDSRRCFYVIPEQNERLFRVKNLIPIWHNEISYMDSWDEHLHIYGVRDNTYTSRAIQISTLSENNRDWSHKNVEPTEIYGKELMAQVAAIKVMI